MIEDADVDMIAVQEVAAKLRSKRDIFYFLAFENEVYLPAMQTISTFFMKQIIQGEKDALLTKDARSSKIPHYPGLRRRDIWPFTKRFPELLRYFPDGTAA